MRWGEYIKRTAVRRLVAIVVGLLVYGSLSYFGYANPYAACQDVNAASAQCESRAEAYAAAKAYVDNVCAQTNAGYSFTCTGSSVYLLHATTYAGEFTRVDEDGDAQTIAQTGTRSWAVECPHGGEWNEDLGQCAESCDSAPELPGRHRWDSGGGFADACINGCSYRGGSAVEICLGENCFGNDLVPTGAQCSTGPTPTPVGGPRPDGVCEAIGNRGAQHCISNPADGGPPTHCIHHASGLSQCWDGSETGGRTNRSGTEGASRDVQPNTPAPHPDQQGAQAEGSSTAGVSGSNGGSFNIVEYSGNGNSGDKSDNGSQPGKGSTPGRGTADGDGDGQGEGQAPDGDGTGTFGEGEDPDPSEAHKEVGMGLNMLDDSGFMSGGSCPTFGTITINSLNISINVDQLSWFCDLMAFLRGVIIFLGAFTALCILMGWRGW